MMSLLVIIIGLGLFVGQLPQRVQCQSSIPFYDGDPNFYFIGNSYTGGTTHTVFREIVQVGIPEWSENVFVESYVVSSQTLARHLGEIGDTKLVTNPVPWKWVTLQEQSQTPGFYDSEGVGGAFDDSLAAVTKLDEYIQAIGSQTMFFMTWGRRNGDSYNPALFADFLTMQDRLIMGYMRYVEATTSSTHQTYVAPVGMVFRNVYNDLVRAGTRPEDDGTLFTLLYHGDGSHPSALGTYVACLTFYTSMTGRDPTLDTTWPYDTDEVTAKTLQKYVARTILDTFEMGFITYPFTTSWTGSVAGTQQTMTTLTIPSSTVMETSSQPMSSKGSLTIQIQYDQYPQDIGWTFIQDGADEALFFQPYYTITTPSFNQIMIFDNLDLDQSFSFKISDVARDGICCTYGDGFVRIIDNNNPGSTKVIYLLSVKSGPYYRADITIDSNGKAIFTGETDQYEQSSWPDMETILWAPTANETGWPGKLPPADPIHTLIVNVDLDNHPEEVAWELWFESKDETILGDDTTDNDWSLIYAWDGSTAMAGTLNSKEFTNLEDGWYRFKVTDKGQNGICCTDDNNASTNGFITLTGTLATTYQSGVIWGSNGQYQGQDEIKLRLAFLGYWTNIKWDANPMAHMPSLSVAPGAEMERSGTKERPTQSLKYVVTSDEYSTEFNGLNSGGSSSMSTVLSSALQVCLVAYLGYSLKLV
jgi:hypothetical protein